MLGGAILKSISFSQYSSLGGGTKTNQSSPTTSRTNVSADGTGGVMRTPPKRKLNFHPSSLSPLTSTLSTVDKTNNSPGDFLNVRFKSNNVDGDGNRNSLSDDQRSLTPTALEFTDEPFEGRSPISKRKRSKPKKLVES